MSCAKTAEQIEMPFGEWTRVGPRNHVWGPDPTRGGGNFRRRPEGHLPAHREVYREYLARAKVIR